MPGERPEPSGEVAPGRRQVFVALDSHLLGRAAAHDEEPEDTFSALREGCSPAGVDTVRRLYGWSTAHGMRPYWGTGQHPSVTAWFEVDRVSIAPWSIWASPRNTNVSVTFDWIAHRGFPQDRLEAFLTALEQIPGIVPRVAGVRQADFRKRPGIRIDDVLAKPGRWMFWAGHWPICSACPGMARDYSRDFAGPPAGGLLRVVHSDVSRPRGGRGRRHPQNGGRGP